MFGDRGSAGSTLGVLCVDLRHVQKASDMWCAVSQLCVCSTLYLRRAYRGLWLCQGVFAGTTTTHVLSWRALAGRHVAELVCLGSTSAVGCGN